MPTLPTWARRPASAVLTGVLAFFGGALGASFDSPNTGRTWEAIGLFIVVIVAVAIGLDRLNERHTCTCAEQLAPILDRIERRLPSGENA